MVLVVDSVDRLTRDIAVTALIKQAIKEAGAIIEYANGTPPGTTPEGELFENLLGAFAQYERAVTRRKTKAGLDRKRKQGIVGGRTPIGYRRENGKLVEDEKEQSAIHVIMEYETCHHLTYRYIAIEMTREWGPIRGRAWQERTIRRIIAREKAKKNDSLPRNE